MSFFFAFIWQVGKPREFSFPVRDHVQIGKELDLFDLDAAAEVHILYACRYLRFSELEEAAWSHIDDF